MCIDNNTCMTKDHILDDVVKGVKAIWLLRNTEETK
jgi:hypothetical protein